MRISVIILILSIGLLACEKSPENESTDETISVENFYKTYDLELVSRLIYLKDDVNNYTETKIENITERKGVVNFVATTFYATEGIFTGKANKKEIDLADLTNSSVSITNTFINLGYWKNPYTSYIEWDFDSQSNLNIVSYARTTAFFPDYFGGQFSGYYNATEGYNMFSTKTFPYGYGGYVRNSGGRMMYVDMYRSKIFYENQNDSSWLELPQPEPLYGNSYDFETVGSDYGVVALTGPASLTAYALSNLSFTSKATTATKSNVQFAGWDGAYTVAIYKNGPDPNKPFIVVRRNNAVDIFKYDILVATITPVHSDIQLPAILHFPSNETFGDCDTYVHFAFTESRIMLKTGNSLYELRDGSFQDFNMEFPVEARITYDYVDSGSQGIYLGLKVTLESGKKVSDIVLLRD